MMSPQDVSLAGCVDIPVRVYKPQLELLNCEDIPYVGFCGGRSSGKSKTLALWLWRWSMEEPALYGCYAPTYPLLSDTIQRTFIETAGDDISDFNQSKNTIKMKSGSEIICRSLDDYERARGPSLRRAAVDEASLCAKQAFDILIGCLRYEGKQGQLACAFTPKGPAHWTAMFSDPLRSDVKCFQASTYDNPFNPPGFAATIRRQYTSAFAEQEIMGRIISLTGTIMQRQWFKIVTEVPPLQSVARYWDMASTQATENNDPDYTVGAKVGLTKDGRWIVLDIRRVRLSPRANELLVEQTASLDGRNVPIFMEEEGGSSGKEMIDHYARNVLTGYSFRGDRPTGDKALRAMPLAAAAEAGNVMLLSGNWNKDFLDEAETFGPDAPHDDQVDAVSGAMKMQTRRYIHPSVGFGQNATERISDLDRQIREGMAELPAEERRELEAQLA